MTQSSGGVGRDTRQRSRCHDRWGNRVDPNLCDLAQQWASLWDSHPWGRSRHPNRSLPNRPLSPLQWERLQVAERRHVRPLAPQVLAETAERDRPVFRYGRRGGFVSERRPPSFKGGGRPSDRMPRGLPGRACHGVVRQAESSSPPPRSALYPVVGFLNSRYMLPPRNRHRSGELRLRRASPPRQDLVEGLEAESVP